MGLLLKILATRSNEQLIQVAYQFNDMEKKHSLLDSFHSSRWGKGFCMLVEGLTTTRFEWICAQIQQCIDSGIRHQRKTSLSKKQKVHIYIYENVYI